MDIVDLSRQGFAKFNLSSVPSPCFVVDEVAVERNLTILADVANQSGAHVLLALKAFSMFALAPLVNRHLAGTCASGLYEARLDAPNTQASSAHTVLGINPPTCQKSSAYPIM